jgi:AcrR family transcriptional regulator
MTRLRAPRRKPTELDLRRTPMQARGQATFDRILDATAQLLEKVGTEALTTNLIAKAADVNVATLYQYFPNKQAVLLSLFERQSEARIVLGERMLQGFTDAPDWRKVLHGAVRAIARSRAEQPGTVALRQAMRSSPDLLEHDQRMSVHVANTLSDELVSAGAKPEQARLVARCAIEGLTALLDMWSIESAGKDDRMVEEAAALLIRYVAPYLDGGKPSRRKRH